MDATNSHASHRAAWLSGAKRSGRCRAAGTRSSSTTLTLGCLGEQMLRKIVGTLFGAQVRLQHLLMADAFRKAGGGRLDIDAVQHLVEQQAVKMPPHTRRSWNGVAFR
jgi:hypothetical protein